MTTVRREYRSPHLSHSGDRLAVTIGPLFGADVWVLDLDARHLDSLDLQRW